MAPRRSPLRADADVMEIRITNIVFVEHEGRTHTEYKIKCNWPAAGKKWTCRRRSHGCGVTVGKPLDFKWVRANSLTASSVHR